MNLGARVHPILTTSPKGSGVPSISILSALHQPWTTAPPQEAMPGVPLGPEPPSARAHTDPFAPLAVGHEPCWGLLVEAPGSHWQDGNQPH